MHHKTSQNVEYFSAKAEDGSNFFWTIFCHKISDYLTILRVKTILKCNNMLNFSNVNRLIGVFKLFFFFLPEIFGVFGKSYSINRTPVRQSVIFFMDLKDELTYVLILNSFFFLLCQKKIRLCKSCGEKCISIRQLVHFYKFVKSERNYGTPCCFKIMVCYFHNKNINLPKTYLSFLIVFS